MTAKDLNALFINEGLTQAERLDRLNRIAIEQMRLLIKDTSVKQLEGDR